MGKVCNGDGVASITCLGEKEVKEAYAGFEKLCFVERKATDDLDYIGFDYESAGGQIAETVISARYHNVLVVTDSLKFSMKMSSAEVSTRCLRRRK